MLLSSEDYGEAIKFGERCLYSMTLEAETRTNFINYTGLSYLKLGFPESALLCFGKNPSIPMTTFYQGVCFLHQANWEMAFDKFEFLRNSSDSVLSFSRQGINESCFRR